jgi:aminoglycoside phosphotransferase (APT) family kinase protein
VGVAPPDERQVLEELGMVVVDDPQELGQLDVLVVSADPKSSALSLNLATISPEAWVLVRAGRLRSHLWDRLGQGSVRALRRRLRAEGLEVTGVHWHAPEQARCSYIVEIDDAIAVTAMLKRYHGVRFGLLKSLIARTLNQAGMVQLVARDLTFLARTRGREERGDASPASTPVLPATTEHRLASADTPPSRLMVTPWFEASRHVICLYFDTVSGLMCGVAKLPRRPWDISGICHEGEVLRELGQRTKALAGQAPEVRGLSTGVRPFLLETPLHGSIASPEAVRADTRLVLEAALDFLSRLPTTGMTTREESWFDRLIEQPLRDVAALVDLEPVPSLVERTLKLLEALRSAEMPMVLEHGDLSHPNLLITDDRRLAAVDWERSEVRGLPAHDLCFLLQYVAESKRATFERDGQRRAFDDAFTGADAWATPWIRRYQASIGLEHRLMAPLLLATWARASAGLLVRLGAGGGSTAKAEHDRTVTASGLAEAFELDRDFFLWRHAVRRFDSLFRP